MEKDGSLDQILYFVLGVLTNPWLAYTVAFGGGLVVAYLARRSPKGTWEFIKEGPAAVLTAAFFLSAGLRSVPRLVVPEHDLVCDRTTGPFGIEETSNCRFESVGEFSTVVDYSLGDMMRDVVVSGIQELVIGGLGAGIGMLLASYTLRRINP